MPSMKEILADKSSRAALIEDCTKLIDEEVQKKGGLSGMALKAGYAVVKGLKPGYIRDTTDGLIDSFAERLSPFVDEAKGKNMGVAAYFEQERSRVAEALLGVTDKRAESSSHKIVNSTYQKLRPTAKKHVEEAVPGVGRLFEKFCG